MLYVLIIVVAVIVGSVGCTADGFGWVPFFGRGLTLLARASVIGRGGTVAGHAIGATSLSWFPVCQPNLVAENYRF